MISRDYFSLLFITVDANIHEKALFTRHELIWKQAWCPFTHCRPAPDICARNNEFSVLLQYSAWVTHIQATNSSSIFIDKMNWRWLQNINIVLNFQSFAKISPKPDVVEDWVTLFHTWKTPGSNLCTESGYSYYLSNTSNQDTSISLHILSN